MISKGYHYVINLGIFSNFLYQYRQDLWRRENPDSPEFICFDRSFAKDQYRRLSGAILWRGTNRELSLEVVTLKDTNLSFGSVSTSVTPSRPRWSRKSIPFVWVSPGEKKMGPNQLFLVWCIWSWLIWVSVKILITFFGFCKVQVPDPA